jgi:hypothetical protein
LKTSALPAGTVTGIVTVSEVACPMAAVGAKWIRYGNEKRKLPVPSSATVSHAPPSLVLTVAPSWLLVEKSRSRVPPGATETLKLAGTAPPICTVTVMVCGASTALGSGRPWMTPGATGERR